MLPPVHSKSPTFMITPPMPIAIVPPLKTTVPPPMSVPFRVVLEPVLEVERGPGRDVDRAPAAVDRNGDGRGARPAGPLDGPFVGDGAGGMAAVVARCPSRAWKSKVPLAVLSSVMVSLMNSPPEPVWSIVPGLLSTPPPNRWLSPAGAMVVPVLMKVSLPGMLMLPPVHWNRPAGKFKDKSPWPWHRPAAQRDGAAARTGVATDVVDGLAAGEVERGARGDGERAAGAGPAGGREAERAGLDVMGPPLLTKLTAMVEVPAVTVFSSSPLVGEGAGGMAAVVADPRVGLEVEGAARRVVQGDGVVDEQPARARSGRSSPGCSAPRR